MATKNDKLILKLQEELKIKEETLVKVNTLKPKTNCVLSFNEVRYNLHVIDKYTTAFLIGQLQNISDGFHKHFPEEDCLLNGFKIEDWIDDLVERYNNLNIQKLKDNIQKLKSKLSNLLSIDSKIELEINSIKEEITNINK